jgi:hypothetical protein
MTRNSYQPQYKGIVYITVTFARTPRPAPRGQLPVQQQPTHRTSSMLRCSAVARVAAGAANLSTQDVPPLTRALLCLAHPPLLARSSTGPSANRSFTRAFATGAGRARTTKGAARTTKTGANATPTKKVKAKAKAKAKKKVVVKKKAPPKKNKVIAKRATPKRKVLTERQRTLVQRKKERDTVKALKTTALEEPKNKPDNAWVVFMSEFTKDGTGPVTTKIKEAAPKFKALSASELEV